MKRPRKHSAPSFEVLDLKIGKDSVFLSDDPIAAAFFPPVPLPKRCTDHEARRKSLEAAEACYELRMTDAEKAADALLLDCPTAQPSMMLSIKVKNVTQDACLFRAVLWGLMAY